MRRFAPIWEVLKVVLSVFISAVIIRYFIFQPFVVEGSSMEPNFHNGEYLFVEKVEYRFHQPHRGDVVVFRYPNDETVNYIKRVIGLPGDTIKIEKGEVFVNGQLLNESYLAPGEETLVAQNPDVPYTVSVGQGQFFMMGDNRNHSADSREGWLVKRSEIVGRSAVVLYPWSDFKAVAGPKY